MPSTVAPARLASCTAIDPTPPAARPPRRCRRPRARRRGPRRRPWRRRRTTRRRLPRYCRWFPGQLSGGDGDEFSVAYALIREAQHVVAGRERVHAGAHRDDHAGEVAALPRGKRRRPAIVQHALADHCLVRIDCGRLDRDQNLAGCRRRSRHTSRTSMSP